MQELTLLEESQIFGDKALDVIKKRGTKAAITDFAILLGGFVSDNYHVDGYNSLDKRTGWYWMKPRDGYDDVHFVYTAVNYVGGCNYNSVYMHDKCGRPALPFSKVQSILVNGVSRKAKDGILEVEYGYYPRNAAPKHIQRELESAINHNILNKTGNVYTTNSQKCGNYDNEFNPNTHIEYEYNSKKYVRVRANSCLNGKFYGNGFILSNGETYKNGDFVWVEVEPVKWLVDKKAKIMVTEELIFAGVQFEHEVKYKGDFSKTDIKKFMDTYLSKELFQNQNTITKNNQITSLSDSIIKTLYSKGYSKEQITTIAPDILNQMLKNTQNTENNVKQK